MRDSTLLHKQSTKVLLALNALACLAMAISLLFTSWQPATTQTTAFRNPLNDSGPDPWMTYYNGSYYLATTTWGDPGIGLTMRKASTIADLKSTSAVRIWHDWTNERCCNYWVPEFVLLNGPNGPHWYGYFSGDRQAAVIIIAFM